MCSIKLNSQEKGRGLQKPADCLPKGTRVQRKPAGLGAQSRPPLIFVFSVFTPVLPDFIPLYLRGLF